MSFGNGLNGSRDVYRTGDLASNEFLRVGDAISITSPLIIESAVGNETLELAEGSTGQAMIRNNSVLPGGGEMVVQSNQDMTVQSVLGDVILNAPLAQLKSTSAGILMTSTAGEQHNITGNLAMTATGSGSVISSGNMTIGGQNTTLNGGSVGVNGFLNVNPPSQAGTNASGAITIANGTAGTAPNTSYTFWAEGNVPNTGRTPGNLDLIRINGAGSLPLMNITPAGNVTIEPVGATFTAPNVKVSNIATQAVTPGQIGGGSATQGNLRPLLIDISTGQLTYPSNALIRMFPVATPDATSSPQKIIDPSGGTYDNSWICCVAGFVNGAFDRTYACWTIAPPFTTLDPVWYVEYDNAGASGNSRVWILAISTALTGTVNYNL